MAPNTKKAFVRLILAATAFAVLWFILFVGVVNSGPHGIAVIISVLLLPLGFLVLLIFIGLFANAMLAERRAKKKGPS